MPQNKHKREEMMSGQGMVIGYPGYRTRDSRSGYDPLDTRAEAAHMEGTFFRQLLSLNLRTRKSGYLFLMFLFGIVPMVATSIGMIELGKHAFIWVFWLFLNFFPILLTINLVRNVLHISGIAKFPPAKPAIITNHEKHRKKKNHQRKKYR